MKKNKTAPDKREKLWAQHDFFESALFNLDLYIAQKRREINELEYHIKKQTLLAAEYKKGMKKVALKIQNLP